MLQRITSAATASASSAAGSTTARSVASLHTPVASCSYTPLRAAAQRVSALPRSGFGQGYGGAAGAACLTRYSSALAGSSLLPTQPQAAWTNHDRCACIPAHSCTIHAPYPRYGYLLILCSCQAACLQDSPIWKFPDMLLASCQCLGRHLVCMFEWVCVALPRHSRGFRVSAQQGDGKRITQNEFTDKAWQSIIAAPDIAKQVCCQAIMCSMMWCLHACISVSCTIATRVWSC